MRTAQCALLILLSLTLHQLPGIDQPLQGGFISLLLLLSWGSLVVLAAGSSSATESMSSSAVESSSSSSSSSATESFTTTMVLVGSVCYSMKARRNLRTNDTMIWPNQEDKQLQSWSKHFSMLQLVLHNHDHDIMTPPNKIIATLRFCCTFGHGGTDSWRKESYNYWQFLLAGEEHRFTAAFLL